MFNSLTKLVKKNTGLLIRLDDISENMEWKYMDKCEVLFDKFNIKPLLGVIPENKDPELLSYPKNIDFWNRVESWRSIREIFTICIVGIIYLKSSYDIRSIASSIHRI